MQEVRCPQCYGPLEVKDVAPCDECGGDPGELKELEEGYHTYSEYEVFSGLHLVLCDFCDADFSSYDPTFFGLPVGERLSIGKWHFVRRIQNPTRGKDKFCTACGHRLSFLRFVVRARQLNGR
jgi:hypothetical protein